MTDYYKKELNFEEKVVSYLQKYGWEKEVLRYSNEQQLIDNWAEILFENNRDIDRLNDCPLTEGEKRQLVQLVKSKGDPFSLNKMVNGKTISILRDNVQDKLHYGKAVSLCIYDRSQIAGGKSRYQIAEQPLFSPGAEMDHNRRGDILLLINGMPVIHIELKKVVLLLIREYIRFVNIMRRANSAVYSR